MSSLFSDFATNPEWEKNGVEFTWETDRGPLFRCRIARNSGANDRIDKLREKLYAPFRRMRKPPEDAMLKIAMRICAEACALPGTWQFAEREGLTCEGNTFTDGVWAPEKPKACVEEGWVNGIEVTPNCIEKDSVDNVTKVFSKLPELYAQISAFAMDVDNYRVQDLEEDAKN